MNKSDRVHSTVGIMVLAVSLVPAGVFGAAGAGGDLEEIVVTAQKRKERLLDVPVPVTAVSSESLIEQNQTKAEDFFSSVPGINLQSMYGRSQLAIRGITTSPVSGNPVVGYTIDDVPFGSSTGNGGLFGAAPDIDPSELRQIEVLRGPQGMLYGAASMGGLVKYDLVEPSLGKFSGLAGVGTEAVAGSGTLGSSLRGAVNIPLSDTLAMRISAFTRSDPGFIDNVRTGEKDANKAQLLGGRLAFLWRPSDALTFKLNMLYQDRDSFGSDSVNVLLGRNQQDNWAGTGRVSTRNQLYSLVVDANLTSDIVLTSVSAYGRNANYDITDFSASAIAGLWQFAFDPTISWGTILRQDYSVNKVSQELRLSMPIGSKIDWLIGAFYTHEGANYGIRATPFDQLTGRIYTQRDFGPTGQPSTYDIPLVWNDHIAFSEYAAFSNMTARFTDRFDVQVGARYSKNKQTMNHREYTLFDPMGLFRNPTSDGNAFTGQISPRFKISPDDMVYARVATGYRAGGPNPSCGDTPCSYKPDKTRNVEVGAKGNFLGGRGTYDLSVYRIDWRDIQLTEVDESGTFTFIENGGTARSEGVETAFDLRPRSGLTLSLWGTYMNAKVRDAFPTHFIFVANGDRLPFSSRLSGRFSATQEFNLTDRVGARVGGSVTYVGDRRGEFIGTPDQASLRQTYPAYALVDLNAGLEVGSLKANLFVQNVLDRQGLNGGGYYNQTNWNPDWFNVTRPRTIGVNLDWSF